MDILCAMAVQQGADRLLDVTQVHVDGCIYASPANLRFAERMLELGARVRVPTTLNAISVDHANWRRREWRPRSGFPRAAWPMLTCGWARGRPSPARPTCWQAPPRRARTVGWAESNAVVYANSVLAARTVKHPDLLDLCIALTGRAPLSGVYLDKNRAARRVIRVERPEGHDEAFWPVLGYLAGLISPDRIPLLAGLEEAAPSSDDLKALCAAFGTTSGAPMLHVSGHTPEASRAPADDADEAAATRCDLARVWRELNAGPEEVDLVALGSPHFSLSECRSLADLTRGGHAAPPSRSSSPAAARCWRRREPRGRSPGSKASARGSSPTFAGAPSPSRCSPRRRGR
jgi:predicted aconitase